MSNTSEQTKEFMDWFIFRVRYRFRAMDYYAQAEGMQEVPLEQLKKGPRFKSMIAKLTSTPIVDKWRDQAEDKKQYSEYMILKEKIIEAIDPTERREAETRLFREKHKIFESIPREWRDATAMRMFDDEMQKTTVYKWINENKESFAEIYAKYCDLAKDNSEEFDKLVKELYDKEISDEYKQKIEHESINSWLHARQANCKMRVQDNNIGIGSMKGGYCLKAVTEILYTMAKANGILKDLPQKDVVPEEFIKELQGNEKFAEFVYKTDREKTFDDIIKEKDIKPGTIVLAINKSGKAQHAMFWDGSKNKDGEATLLSFNNEAKDIKAAWYNDGSVRQMYIVDVYKMVENGFRQRENYPQTKNNDASLGSQFDVLLLKKSQQSTR